MNQPDFPALGLDSIICLGTQPLGGIRAVFENLLRSQVRRTLFLGVRLFPEDSGIFPAQMRHGHKPRKPRKGKTNEEKENLEGTKKS